MLLGHQGGGALRQGLEEHQEAGALRQEPEEPQPLWRQEREVPQGLWRQEREEVSPEDAGRLGHQGGGVRQELPEHQEGEGPQERLGAAGHLHRRDAGRQVLLGQAGHQRYQLLHTPSHGRREAAAGSQEPWPDGRLAVGGGSSEAGWMLWPC